MPGMDQLPAAVRDVELTGFSCRKAGDKLELVLDVEATAS